MKLGLVGGFLVKNYSQIKSEIFTRIETSPDHNLQQPETRLNFS